MENCAIIIFQKNRVAGKVKTRLAQSIGKDKALAIYDYLVQYTHKILAEIEAQKFLFFSDFIESSYSNSSYHLCPQEGKDLGERMKNAFQHTFKFAEKVLIIGTDCIELQSQHLLQAFEILTFKDAVLGTATDGGYYLLGLRKLYPEIFAHKQWSTDTVAQETCKDFEKMCVPYGLLPVLSDIDVVSDLPDEIVKKFL